jgi:hypothetical protein
MNHRLLFLLAALSLPAYSQPWSTFINPSRAIDWTSAGFTIPNYTANCATQPSLTANNSGAASANATAIQNALASCDATHNVVNIPAGTYYVAGFTYGSQGKQVVRGAGPMATTIILTAQSSCYDSAVCMISNPASYSNGTPVLPGGTQQCTWSSGYTQGSTTITLTNCGGAPPLNKMLILDQANETSDTGGVYLCDNATLGCTVETRTVPSGNGDGRIISNVTHSLQQVVLATGVTSLGGGSYSVTISPGVYFNNIRSAQSPGAYWTGFVQNDGLENLTVDHSYTSANTAINMYNCYQCWVKNIRSLNAARDHVWINLGLNDVVRDSYFYAAQSSGSQSYAVEVEESSGALIENNIFQQTTNPLMFGQGTGNVVGYNFSIDNIYSGGSGQFVQASYAGHNAGNAMNLWEGNNFVGIWSDANWGSNFSSTLFRNMLSGWQTGKTANTVPVIIEAWSRAFNVIGNVLGQPAYHNQYEAYATSTTNGVNIGAPAETSIFSLGFTGNGGNGTCTASPTCDSLIRPSLMRWGNWDTVTNGAKWDSTEASPGTIPYVNANFTASYFGSLAHTLPSSLYYGSTPSWWPTGKAWPSVGPDVSSGNLGTCSGTYAGAQATASGQCPGGALSSAWAAHANSIPAQDCYLNVMGGRPDGTGSVLTFDANQCYGTTGTTSSNSTPPPSPTVPTPTGLTGSWH